MDNIHKIKRVCVICQKENCWKKKFSYMLILWTHIYFQNNSQTVCYMCICVKCFEIHACGGMKSTMVVSQFWRKRILLLPFKFSVMLRKMKYVYQSYCYSVFFYLFCFVLFFLFGGGGGVFYKITHGNLSKCTQLMY